MAQLNELQTTLSSCQVLVAKMAVDDDVSFRAKAEQYDEICDIIQDYWIQQSSMRAAEAIRRLVEEWRVRNTSS